MKTRAGPVMLAALVIAGVATAQPYGLARKTGELADLKAWIDKMPPGPASIQATGTITAPSGCYDALAQFAGLDDGNPPIYRVNVTLWKRHGYCTQSTEDVRFFYRRPNYAGRAERMTIISERESKTIPIEIAY
jgi:hypothetical protein